MIKANYIKESPMPPSQQLEENPFNLVMSSSSSQEDTKEEELLFLNHLPQETFWSLVHMPLTEFLLRESTQHTSFQHQQKSHSPVLLQTLMIPFSKDKEHGLKANWRTLQNKDWKESNNQSKVNKNGEIKLSKLKRQLILNFWPISLKSNNWRDIWEPDSLFLTTQNHTIWNFDLYSYLNKIFRS